MMIRQHKHKWNILLFALCSFFTKEPWKLFLREYGSNNITGINWVECHEGEIGITRYGFKPKKDIINTLYFENKSLIKYKIKKIINILKD